MFGYSTDLRSTTQGRATYTMQFDHYDEVPGSIAERVIEQRTGVPDSSLSNHPTGAIRPVQLLSLGSPPGGPTPDT